MKTQRFKKQFSQTMEENTEHELFMWGVYEERGRERERGGDKKRLYRETVKKNALLFYRILEHSTMAA